MSEVKVGIGPNQQPTLKLEFQGTKIPKSRPTEIQQSNFQSVIKEKRRMKHRCIEISGNKGRELAVQ